MRFFLLAFLFALLVVNVLAEECNDICIQDYTPVCAGGSGISQQTFSNACALDVYNCKHGTVLAVLRQGEC